MDEALSRISLSPTPDTLMWAVSPGFVGLSFPAVATQVYFIRRCFRAVMLCPNAKKRRLGILSMLNILSMSGTRKMLWRMILG